MLTPRAVDRRKPPSQIAHFVHESPVRVGDVECLHQLQARSSRRLLVYRICCYPAPSSDDDKRARCHDESLTKKFWPRIKGCALHLYRLIRFWQQDCVAEFLCRNRLLAASAFFLCAQGRKLHATFLPGFLACLSLRPAYELEQAAS